MPNISSTSLTTLRCRVRSSLDVRIGKFQAQAGRIAPQRAKIEATNNQTYLHAEYNHVWATPSGNMSELDRMRKGGFDKNRAELKTAFTESQMYIRNIFGKNLGHKAYNLPPYEQIDRSALPDVPTQRTREDAIRWYEQNVRNERIKDYAGRSIIFSRSTLERHLKDNYLAEGRQNLLPLISQCLQHPDEVWFQRPAGDKFQFLLCLFTKKGTMAVPVVLDKNAKMTLRSWFILQGDDERKGILVKTKKG